MTGYTEKIRQWAMDNRHTGPLPEADGTGEVGLDSAEVGTRLAVRFALKTRLDRVTEIRFQVFGCGFTIAACAAAADMSMGDPIQVGIHALCVQSPTTSTLFEYFKIFRSE